MNGTAVYRETSVTTQSRGQLIVMLYDGAIKFLNQAVLAIGRNDNEGKSRLICRGQDIVFELNTVLDMEAGGEVSRNLRKLYNFMWRRLGQANASNDIQMIREVIGLLEELNGGWKAITR